MVKEIDIYQKLSLMRMNLVTIRRQLNNQLDTMDAELETMIPEDQVRYGRKHTVAEMRASLYALMPNKKTHKKGKV